MMNKSPWIKDLEWFRAPQQSRGERTFSLLLDAAEALISEHGLDNLAVGDIAKRAGCSVGALYHHFPDKDALIQALFGRMAYELRETMHAALDPERWRGVSIAEILEAYLQFSIEKGRAHGRLRRAQLVLELREIPAAAPLLGVRRELGQRLRDLLLARREEIGHPAPELAIDFAIQQLRSMFILRIEGGNLGSTPGTVSDVEFVQEALTSLCSYLQIPPPLRPEHPAVGLYEGKPEPAKDGVRH